MSPEFLEALRLVEEFNQQRPTDTIEYRLYYDEDGAITGFSESNHPPGNYIVVDSPDVFHKNNTYLLRVVNQQLKIIDPHRAMQVKLHKSTSGQQVVKGMAAIALEPAEIYQDIEYYDRKTNN